MLVFLNPLAFWGLFSLLAVTAIYLFRRQSKDVRVSSLIFWSHVKTPAEGGRKITTLQIPFLLIIELCILILLILAAATPKIISARKHVPIAIILDDSLSMNAHVNGETARDRAIHFIKTNLLSLDYASFTIFRAGVKNQIMGRSNLSGAEVLRLLDSWHCRSSASDISSAIRDVKKSSPVDAMIFIVTDNPSNKTLAENLTWLAFGKYVPNIGIVGSSRYALGNMDICFFEFANFSSEKSTLLAEILNADTKRVLKEISVELAPNARCRVRLPLEDTAITLKVIVKNDSLEFDNQVYLMPVRREPLKVEIHASTPYFLKLMSRTIESSGIAKIVARDGALAIFENPPITFSEIYDAPNRWNLVIHNATSPVTVSELVAVDKNHPLAQGLPKFTAVWAFDKNFIFSGKPLMSLSGISLFSYKYLSDSRLDMAMNISLLHSNLQYSPVWPIIFWNMFKWRQEALPGFSEFNYPSGSDIKFTISTSKKELSVLAPSATVYKIPVWHGKGHFIAEEHGIYNLKTETEEWKIAVNLNSVDESDLTSKSSYIPDYKLIKNENSRYLADARWWFLVPALLLMTLHQWIAISRRTKHVC